MVHAPAQVPGVCGGDPLCDREGRAHQRGRERGGRRSVQRQITECSVYHAGAEGGASDSASRAHGDVDHGKSILVRAGVEATVGAAIDMSIAGHTQRRYASAWKRYLGWCRSLEEEPLPVTEDKAMAYVAVLAREGLKAGTVKYHLAGLRMAQIKAGMRAPDWSTMDRLAQLRKGLARMEAVGGRVTLVREPVKWVHMRAMHSV